MMTFARVGPNDVYTVRMLWAGIIASFTLINICTNFTISLEAGVTHTVVVSAVF